MRVKKEGKNYGRENEEITHEKKWEYEKWEVIIWRNEWYEEEKNKSQKRRKWNKVKNNGPAVFKTNREGYFIDFNFLLHRLYIFFSFIRMM